MSENEREKSRFIQNPVSELKPNGGDAVQTNDDEAETTFTVTVDDEPVETAPVETAPVESKEEKDSLMGSRHGLELYSQDRHFIGHAVKNFLNYTGGVEPSQGEIDSQKQNKGTEKANLGTLLGVYFPCIQNIFGVLFFIRLVWIVGTAGLAQAFLIVFISCSTTLLTAISMSAIATNGIVPGGGSYFMISRSLGPEFGGAVGILFYFATSFAASMYILGAIEIVMKYFPFRNAVAIPPWTDLDVDANLYMNYRIYGFVLLLLLFVCVFIGVRFVSKFAVVSLACVILSILCVFIGIFSASSKLPICFVNDALIKSQWLKNPPTQLDGVIGEYLNLTNQYVDRSDLCNICPWGPVFKHACSGSNINLNTLQEVLAAAQFNRSTCSYGAFDQLAKICDLSIISENHYERKGIGPISGKRFADNFGSFYPSGKGQLIDEPGQLGSDEKGQVLTGELATFFTLLALFFPSCTGIMAGSNRSGDLADAQKSIPLGTILAILTTSTVYLSGTIFFGTCVDGSLLRDKFGEGIDEKLVIANLAFPHEWVILIGSLLSTIGAGLQSLTGAPRLLQAIALDGVLPILHPFQRLHRGEPLFAQLATSLIVLIGIAIANVDGVTPIITMFFLMCYAFVNLACALQTILKAPSWRPRFKFYHWSLSLFGMALCLFIMFSTHWYYALAAIGIAVVVYKYIEFKGAEKEWGDGVRGLQMSAARYALMRLEENPPHVKNWRPRILLLTKCDETTLQSKNPRLFDVIRQLKYGKGLVMVSTVLQGRPDELLDRADECKANLKRLMAERKVEGFASVLVTIIVCARCWPFLNRASASALVCEDQQIGFSDLLQLSGLGGLRPNTLLLGWPRHWRDNLERTHGYVALLRLLMAQKRALVIAKNVDHFYEARMRLQYGYIDVWWIVHDGGLLVLLPFLLMQHKTYAKCQLRIFAIAMLNDDSVQMKRDLENYFYQLRIHAQVFVIEMPTGDISAYAYEKTMVIQQRSELLREMTRKEQKRDIQNQLNKTRLTGTAVTAATDEAIVSSSPMPARPSVPEIQIGRATPDRDLSLAGDYEEVATEVTDKGDSKKRVRLTSVDAKDTRALCSGEASNLLDTEQSMHRVYTFSGSSGDQLRRALHEFSDEQRNTYKQMHTAVGLNRKIVEHSKESCLVILNLPSPPQHTAGDLNYMEYVDVLSENIDRVLLVKGSGREVVTMFS